MTWTGCVAVKSTAWNDHNKIMAAASGSPTKSVYPGYATPITPQGLAPNEPLDVYISQVSVKPYNYNTGPEDVSNHI